MDNKNTVSLSQNSETTLFGDMKFFIADNKTLRFYPEVINTDPGTYEVRGNVVSTGSKPSWNAQSFAGFFYDIKENVSTETLQITTNFTDLQADRTIPENELVYTTGKAPVAFKAHEKENVTVDDEANYQVVGWMAEKWIAVNNVSNKIAKLAFEMGKDDKKTLSSGETWALGSGYELTINAVDARASPRQVWFTLKKDGALIDEGIGQAPTDSGVSAKQKAVYTKKMTILGESDSLLFTVYVDSIFSGSASDMVQFKYAWLIDSSTAKEISGSDEFGVFQVTQANDKQIKMDNKNTVSLSRNTETTLFGDMRFFIADNSTLRFYPKVDYTISGNATPIGTGTATVKGTAKPTTNVTSNVTAVVPTVPPTVVPTEPATTGPAASPTTVPGFEAVFAIAGLLAVAYIVLRQRK
jgi:S-layer protein (TIGR01567 family)